MLAEMNNAAGPAKAEVAGTVGLEMACAIRNCSSGRPGQRQLSPFESPDAFLVEGKRARPCADDYCATLPLHAPLAVLLAGLLSRRDVLHPDGACRLAAAPTIATVSCSPGRRYRLPGAVGSPATPVWQRSGARSTSPQCTTQSRCSCRSRAGFGLAKPALLMTPCPGRPPRANPGDRRGAASGAGELISPRKRQSAQAGGDDQGMDAGAGPRPGVLGDVYESLRGRLPGHEAWRPGWPHEAGVRQRDGRRGQREADVWRCKDRERRRVGHRW